MHGSKVAGLALMGAAALTCAVGGCEDGPIQTFSPAPPGAAWNNGGSDASTSDPGSQSFEAGGGGTNKVNICTASDQRAKWQTAFTAPIFPPFQVGGIDLSAAGKFAAVTLDDAEQGLNGNAQLCQGTPGQQFCTDGTGSPGYAWGESQQLQICYDVATHQITALYMLPGYDGTATFTLPAKWNGQDVPYAHDKPGDLASAARDRTYVWKIGAGVTENGALLDMQWAQSDGGATHTKGGASDVVANRIFLAMTYQFAPTLIGVTDKSHAPPLTWLTDPGFNCVSAGLCRTSINTDGSGGNYGARTVALYGDWQYSNSSDAAQRSTPTDMYIYPAKYMPFSFANYNMGLDTFIGPNTDASLTHKGAPIYGAYTPAGVLSPPGAVKPTPFCTLYMGLTYGEFKRNCVMVSGDGAADGLSLAKLLGGQHHAPEWYQFNVNGQNAFFSADPAQLAAPDYVLADSAYEPPDDAVASALFNDIRSYGLPFNDLRGNQFPPAPAGADPIAQWEDRKVQGQDFHGTSAVMGYFRQLVFDDLRAQLAQSGVTPVADPATCFTGPNPAPGHVFPAGCTGFEMMVTSSFPLGLADTKWQDQMDRGPKAYHAPTIFRSGDPAIDFMSDPSLGGADDLFTNGVSTLVQGSLLQVQAVVGHGDITRVPARARDWRYYLTIFAQAYTKYLLNRRTNPTWHDLYKDTCGGATCRQVNQDALFFDLSNGLDRFEYVDRSQADRLGSPVDFEYDMQLNSSNTQQLNFYQRLTRAESAVYTAMLTDKTKVPGSNENVNVTDLFGAPAIATLGLGAAADAAGNPVPGKDAWYCATTLPVDPQCPNGPPADANGNVLVDGQGRPLFTAYRGVFTGTPFTIGHTLPITQVLPYVQGALVDLPNYANPYDMTSKNAPLSVFVPHIPSQPGNGFEIPINAQRSQFVQTGSLDFSGVTITLNVDYLPKYDASGALTGAQIAAVETQDFLGEVWPCVDPLTKDILRVKMYSSFLDIQNWLDSHPGTRTSCNIFVRMSPYNNWPDYMWSTTNGVLLAVNAGAGGGPPRIADVTLFNPGLLTQTQ